MVATTMTPAKLEQIVRSWATATEAPPGLNAAVDQMAARIPNICAKFDLDLNDIETCRVMILTLELLAQVGIASYVDVPVQTSEKLGAIVPYVARAVSNRYLLHKEG